MKDIIAVCILRKLSRSKITREEINKILTKTHPVKNPFGTVFTVIWNAKDPERMKDVALALKEQDKKVLAIEARKTIYLVVKKYAGSHFREIQRKSKLAVGSVQHHLHYLVKHGLIKEVKEGKNVVYFPREIESGSTKILSFLRQKSIRDILLHILVNKNCNHEQFVKVVKLSPSTISWHLKKLQQADIISSTKKGRKTFYKLVVNEKELVTLLITYQESFVDKLVDRVIEMWGV